MQRTKSKILSILLSLVMLLSLLPTTALAAGNPDPTAVSVNGGISFSSSNLYYTNGASACSNNSTGWNAAYDPTTGTLTLDGYSGGSIRTGGTDADITVVLKGTNTIDDGSLMNDMGGDITITSDCGGTLSITNTLSNSNPAIGIEAGLSGSYQTGNVTITGDAKVTINMTNNGTSTWEKAYGIYAKENITISGDASVDITCKTPYNTARFGDYCNGLYAKNNVTIDTSGTIKIDVKNAGGDDAYSFGIYPMSGATLTKVGNMEVQWKKGVSSGGAVYKGVSFDTSTYAVNVDEANCTATYTPKVAATITSVSATVSQPMKGHPLDTSVNVGGATTYTADVMWKADGMTVNGNAQADTVYTALITLRAKEGEAFSSSLNNTTTPGGYSIEWLNSTELLLTKEFDRTNLKDATGITIDDTTLTVAVPTAEPNTEQKAELPLTAKVIYDDGTDETVDVTWSIVPDPKPEGVDIEADGKLTVTNKAADGTVEVKAAYNGMIDKKTVTITKDTPVESAIVLTAPASTTVAVPKSDTPNEIDLPTAAVYDQYGMSMTGTSTITYAIDGDTPTGVKLDSATGKLTVKRSAQAGEVKVIAKLGTTLTSDPVAYTITRETSKVTHVLVSKLFHNMPVPKVTEPGGTSSKDEQFTAEVLDQYLQEMTGQTVTWRVTDTAGKPVHGVSIDNTGKLTVTNEAPGIKVYAIATCQGVDSNNLDMTLHRDTAKDTFVKICNQVGDAPETSLLIPAATFTNSEAYTAKVYDQYGAETGGMVFWKLDKTYTGVELDTTTSTGNAILKVENTATPGTIKLTAKCSTASKTLDITLTKKTVDTTSLKVTQADTTYGTALADPVFTKPEGTIKTLVHYSTPTSSAYSSATKPTDAGEYVVNVVCETATHIYTGHANFKIEPKSISNLLQPITGTYVYSGAPQKPTAVVMDGTKKLVEGTDYTVSYGTNVHVYQAATVYVEGKGNYTGTFSRNFKIQPKPIDIGTVLTTNRDYEEGRLDVDCTVTLPVAAEVKQGEHYHVYATMADDTAGTGKTVNVLVKMEKGGLGENYTLNKDTTTATVNINKINPADPTGLKGVKGQKLFTVELPAGWTWYAPSMVMDTVGSQTFLVNYAGDANHNALHMQPITVYVLDKTDVSTFITFPDGEKEYTGSWMEYKEASISGTNLGTGAKWNYAYTAGTGTLMAAGYPQGIGTYTVTATYEDSINFGIATATLTITAKKVAIPAADTTVFTYDGNAKTYGISDTADYTVTGNSQTNAGDHTVTVALKDKATTAWADGTTADKTYTFTIKQATPTGEPKYTAITTSGKKLSDAALTTTGSTLNPNAGTLVWVDNAGNVLPDTTAVAANTTYKWLFTPTDTNYTTLTGSIELWHKSTSSGGSYYAPVVPDMPMVYWGCTGDAVKTLQEKLNAKGFHSGNVDGIFGAKTYAAVTAFQKANSLGVDGIVGKLTWAKLYDATPVNVTPVTTQPMLRTGSRGDAVRKLQELLNAKGYTCGSVDGIFGSKTYAAVLAFQKANGLAADGIVGSLTWGKLV